MKNQKIKCNVESCDFQDCDCCTLKEIQVDCSCGCNDATHDKETLCKSFKCNKKAEGRDLSGVDKRDCQADHCLF